MKKTIAILLVAILAVSSVFAAFSGKASIGAGVNLDNGNYGFIDQSTNAKIDLELATANAENVGEGDIYASIKASLVVKLFNGEKGGEPDDPMGPWTQYIAVDLAEAKVGGENWYVSVLGMPDGPDYAKSAIDTYDVKGKYDDYGFVKEDYTENYTFKPTYADTNGIELGLFGYKFGFGLLGDYDETGDIKNWKFEDNIKFAVFGETPEYDFSGLKLQGAVTYSYSGFDKIDDGVVVKQDEILGKLDPVTGKRTVLVPAFSRTNALSLSAKVGFENDTLSASVATDMGFNLDGDDFDEVFDMDVAANFNWSFLTLDAYYATKAKAGGAYSDVIKVDDNYNMVTTGGDITAVRPIYSTITDKDGTKHDVITGFEVDRNPVVPVTESKWVDSYKNDVLSFQAKFDLNTFEVPVAITASVKDVLHTVELGVKAEVTPVEGLKLTANAGYVVDTLDAYNKAEGYAGITDKDEQKDYNDMFKEEFKGVFLGQWKFGLDAEYDFGFAKVAAGVSLKNAGLKSFFEDTFDPDFEKKVQDKTFKEEADYYNYYVNQVVLGMSASVSTESIIPGAELKLAWDNADDLLSLYKYNADAEKYNFGKITASCTIEF